MLETHLHFLINFHKKNLQFARQLLLQLLSLLQKAQFASRKKELLYAMQDFMLSHSVIGFVTHRVAKFVFDQEETEKLQTAHKEVINCYNLNNFVNAFTSVHRNHRGGSA